MLSSFPRKCALMIPIGYQEISDSDDSDAPIAPRARPGIKKQVVDSDSDDVVETVSAPGNGGQSRGIPGAFPNQPTAPLATRAPATATAARGGGPMTMPFVFRVFHVRANSDINTQDAKTGSRTRPRFRGRLCPESSCSAAFSWQCSKTFLSSQLLSAS